MIEKMKKKGKMAQTQLELEVFLHKEKYLEKQLRNLEGEGDYHCFTKDPNLMNKALKLSN
jgi:hypothetical protein